MYGDMQWDKGTRKENKGSNLCQRMITSVLTAK